MKAKESQFPEGEHDYHAHGSEWTHEALEAYKADMEEEAKKPKKGTLPNSYLPPNAAPF
jgi:hypothetical protein